MTDFDKIQTYDDSSALVPEEISTAMLKSVSATSAALQLATRIPVSRRQVKFPVLSALPQAYWVDGDTGLKKTTKAAWDKKYMHIEELAVIVPVPEAVLDDTPFDIFGNLRPLLEGAFARKIDAAIFMNDDKPASWDESIAELAEAAGNTEDIGTSAQNLGGIAEDFNLLYGKVEALGYDVNGVVASPALKAALRGARDTTGQQLVDVSSGSILGAKLITDAMRGMWGDTSYLAFVGDFSQAVIGVRQDITYKVLDQAVITDETGSVVLNLAQQDAVALRVVMRLGYAVANPLNYDNEGNPDASSFGILFESGH